MTLLQDIESKSRSKQHQYQCSKLIIEGRKTKIVRAEYYKTIQNSINKFSCVLNSSQHTQHSGRGLQEDNTSCDGFRRLILNCNMAASTRTISRNNDGNIVLEPMIGISVQVFQDTPYFFLHYIFLPGFTIVVIVHMY